MPTINQKFFNRQGGVSTGIYDSLNCGIGSDDDPASVQENLKRVCEEIGCQPENLQVLYQTHSDICLTIDEVSIDRPEADAHVTDKPGVALGILTADCAPVLFYGRKENGDPVIGAAHAGWKGAYGGVLEATIKEMKTLGAQDIAATIGPCIAKASYEVTQDFAIPILKRHEEAEKFFIQGKQEGHLNFDLVGYCAFRLALSGVTQIEIIDHDTYTMEEEYFSNRRRNHRGEPDYGRQISIIVIKR